MFSNLVPLLITTAGALSAMAAPLTVPPNLSQLNSNMLHSTKPLPNPYPMPDTSYSLAFSAPGPTLPRRNVVACIFTVRLKMKADMRTHGELGPFVAPREWPCEADHLVFGIAPFTVPVGARPMTWNDAYEVLEAFSRKMLYEGYHGWWARLQETHGGRVVARASIGP